MMKWKMMLGILLVISLGELIWIVALVGECNSLSLQLLELRVENVYLTRYIAENLTIMEGMVRTNYYNALSEYSGSKDIGGELAASAAEFIKDGKQKLPDVTDTCRIIFVGQGFDGCPQFRFVGEDYVLQPGEVEVTKEQMLNELSEYEKRSGKRIIWMNE